jgi:Peptidase family M1 domain
MIFLRRFIPGRIALPALAFLVSSFFVHAQDVNDYPDVAIFENDVIAEVASVIETLRAPVYRLELTLSDDLLRVEGKADVWVTNTSNDIWNELVFRLYPNALGSNMVVAETLVDGVDVATSLEVEDTVLRVPVSLEPDGQARVSFIYTLEISAEVRSYGRLAKYRDALSLSHAYPTLSVYQNGVWLAAYPTDLGDPLVAEASLFEVTIVAPAAWQVITTGQTLELTTTTEDRQRLHITTGPARDFYIAAVHDYNELSQQVGGTRVRVFAPAKFTRGARSALETAVKALTLFSKLYTPYPYKEFDIVAIPVEAGGIEYPGMVAITSGLFVNTGKMTSVIVHETAHQWSFNVVGSDQINSPWLDESLTQYLTWRFQKEVNPGFVAGYEKYWQTTWDKAEHPELRLGLPVSAYNKADYAGIIYGKGLFFFKALADVMGQEAFDNALQGYLEHYTWQFISPEAFKDSLELSCACDLTPLFEQWVESR